MTLALRSPVFFPTPCPPSACGLGQWSVVAHMLPFGEGGPPDGIPIFKLHPVGSILESGFAFYSGHGTA